MSALPASNPLLFSISSFLPLSSPRSLSLSSSFPIEARRRSSCLFKRLCVQEASSNATPNEDSKPPNGNMVSCRFLVYCVLVLASKDKSLPGILYNFQMLNFSNDLY